MSCARCGRPAHRKCSRCHQVSYCSNNCRKRHRSQHECRFPQRIVDAIADLRKKERRWLLYDISPDLRKNLAKDLHPDERGNVPFDQLCTSLHVVGVILGILPAFWMTMSRSCGHTKEFFEAVLIPWFENHRTLLEGRGLKLQMINPNLEGPNMYLTCLGYTNAPTKYEGRYILWSELHSKANVVKSTFLSNRHSTFTVEQGFECMVGFPLSPAVAAGDRWSISFMVSNVNEIYRVNHSEGTAIMTLLPNVKEQDAVRVGKLFRRLFLAYAEAGGISLQMVIEPLLGWAPGSIAALFAVASVSKREEHLVQSIERDIERGVIEFTDSDWWGEVEPTVRSHNHTEERRRQGSRL